MSDSRGRSKTGCLTCKNRHKKCDEKRPVCERCTRANMDCLGYSYLNNPVHKPRKPRTVKPPVFASLEASAPVPGPSHQDHQGLATQNVPVHHASSLASNPLPNQDILPGEMWSPLYTDPGDASLNSAVEFTPAKLLSLTPLPGQPISPQGNAPNTSSVWWDSGLTSDVSETRHGAGNRHASTSSAQNASVPSESIHGGYQSGASRDNPADLLPLAARFFQSQPDPGLFVESPLSSHRLAGVHPDADSDDGLSETSEDSETEGVMSLLDPVLALDRSASGNALPFVLSSYLRWMTRIMFEPLKVAQWTKDDLIKRFTISEDSRSGILLVATVLDALDKDPGLALEQFPAMVALERRVNHKFLAFKSGQELSSEKHMSSVLNTLYEMQTVLTIQCRMRPISYVVRKLQEVAYVHRKACSDLPGAPVHLLSRLLHPEPILRHFPAMDIFLSLCICQPMSLQYDITSAPGSLADASELKNIGLQRTNGIPDQFLVMLARMNTLREAFAPNVTSRVIQELESEIRRFQSVLDESPDPHLQITRLVVHESWRQAMYIYLYMGLCGASNDDPRVETALKKLMKLVDRIKPGRRPDFFLGGPLLVAGMAARRKYDRLIIQQRILSVRESVQIGTSGDDSMRMLLEVWTTSDSQGRPTVWNDLRVAFSRVVGEV